MNSEKFEEVLRVRMDSMKAVLIQKGKECASSKDRLHTFKRAAEIERCTPEKALVGMLTKHIVSVLDAVDGIENLTEGEIQAIIKDKIQDCLNYFILLEALMVERADALMGKLTSINEAVLKTNSATGAGVILSTK